VLRDGASVGEGSVATASEPEIVSLMVGRSVEDLFPTVPHNRGEAILTLDRLSGARSPRDVSLTLHRGEILGIAGLVGAGRTELLRTIYGLDPIHGGSLRMHALPVGSSPRARIRAGMGMVSEDRKTEGLAQSLSIADNVTASRLQPYSRWGLLAPARLQQAVEVWMRKLSIKARSPLQPVASLSGGNQQKVALARVIHQAADIFLLDEPTRGIDVGTKAEIYRLVGQLAAEGKAIIFVSSYLPELLAVCDRVGVMARGRLREIRPVADWTEDSVMACAISTDDGV
jgi:ribose transport system ATP-binding protein